MTANVIVTVEREFDNPRSQVFRAWTEPAQLAQWRGSPGLARRARDPRRVTSSSVVGTIT